MYDWRVESSESEVESMDEGRVQIQVEFAHQSHLVSSDVVDGKHSALHAKRCHGGRSSYAAAGVGLHRHSYKFSATTM